MIKIENVDICGLEPAIRGMRNPMNSWKKSDSLFYSGINPGNNEVYVHNIFKEESIMPNNRHYEETGDIIGDSDLDLMIRLAEGGPVHAKYRRMIIVYVDITAPLYWWKEFDTYKVGTVANSCSTMHKIQAKEFTPEDFSCEHLYSVSDMCYRFPNEKKPFNPAITVEGNEFYYSPKHMIEMICQMLNFFREKFNETGNKEYWWQMIQLLPSSYNQKRTVMLNYEVLHNIYKSRKGHKLDEWREVCRWIEDLPLNGIITLT